ncbi:MAG: AAA family ATPase [Candidatus Micrarchaeia archaeon]
MQKEKINKPQKGKKISKLKWQYYSFKERFKELFYSPHFESSVLIFLGSLSSFLMFPFYPLPILILLSFLVSYVTFYIPTIGFILLLFLLFPAIAYQSSVLAWLSLFIFGISLLFVFENHKLLSFVLLLLTLPFTSLWFFEFLILILFSLRVGSKRSLISTLLIFFILYSFTTGLGKESKIIVYNKEAYSNFYSIFSSTIEACKIEKNASLTNMIKFFSNFSVFGSVSEVTNAINLFILAPFVQMDKFFIQLIIWANVCYFIAFFSSLSRSKYRSFYSSFFILEFAVYYFLFSTYFFELLIYLFLSIFMILIFESYGYEPSLEIEVVKKDMGKKFLALGIEDLSFGSKEKMDDIGNYEETKKEIYEGIVMPIEEKAMGGAYGVKPVKGVLLFGPPGTGKTLLMRALANEIKVGLYYVKASSLLSPYQGVTEKNISEVFSLAKKNAPCILFFDEIDAIAPKRELTESEENRRVLSALLQELDGFTPETNIIFVGATNAPNLIDPALLRPGRIDKIIYFPLPDEKGRKAIFKVHTKNLPLKNVDFDKLAKITERYSGADIQNVCKEVTRRAAARAAKTRTLVYITMKDFIDVIKAMKPSTSIEQLEMYEQFRKDFERRTELKKEIVKEEKRITFDDVANLEDVKTALRDALELPLLHRDLMKKYGVQPIKGILLFGPPGCGKTYIMKAAANEINVNFFSVNGSQTMKLGKERAVLVIREIFNRAKENAPSIIFIDEIDAIVPKREKVSEDEIMVVTEFLTQLDGIKDLENVVLVGATNRPNAIDPAMLRPGRFDKIVFVPLPSKEARKVIFSLNLQNISTKNVDLDRLVEKTMGYTGADIASICREVKTKALTESIKTGKPPVVTMQDLLYEIEKTKPSVTEEMMEEYLIFLAKYGERK